MLNIQFSGAQNMLRHPSVKVRKCDDDNSVIVRCYDIEGKDAEISFKLFKDVKAVFQTNLIEEEPKPLKSKTTNGFVFKLGHHAIETFKMDL